MQMWQGCGSFCRRWPSSTSGMSSERQAIPNPLLAYTATSLMLHGRMQSVCIFSHGNCLLKHFFIMVTYTSAALCRLVLVVLSPFLAYGWKAWCMAMKVHMMINHRRDGHGFWCGGLVIGPLHTFHSLNNSSELPGICCSRSVSGLCSGGGGRGGGVSPTFQWALLQSDCLFDYWLKSPA